MLKCNAGRQRHIRLRCKTNVQSPGGKQTNIEKKVYTARGKINKSDAKCFSRVSKGRNSRGGNKNTSGNLGDRPLKMGIRKLDSASAPSPKKKPSLGQPPANISPQALGRQGANAGGGSVHGWGCSHGLRCNSDNNTQMAGTRRVGRTAAYEGTSCVSRQPATENLTWSGSVVLTPPTMYSIPFRRVPPAMVP